VGVRWTLPQPFEDIGHTADVGVRVQGASAEEALARLVLAEAALLAGGGPVRAEREERVASAATDEVGAVVGILRELLFRFATARAIAAWCEVERLDASGAAVRVGLGPWSAEAHAEGVDLKAVTWHAARLERGAAGTWWGQVVFDI
jgi:SHS2 domain-containing protein